MRKLSTFFVLLGLAMSAQQYAWAIDWVGDAKPYGLTVRVPWTTSRVVGSPDPPPPYRSRRVYPALNFKQPIYVTPLPLSDQLLLIHHLGSYVGPGKIVRFRDDQQVDKAEPWLEMDRVMYGLAFHPDFARNGYVYVGSNGPDSQPVHKTDRVSRFTVEREPPYRCDPKSEQVVLEWASNGHNGADLAFGPDGFLYIATGDGTSDSDQNDTGQTLNDLCAGMLRIDVNKTEAGKPYAVPPDNPFVDRPGARGELWAYGLRNPWRISFDRRTGQLWVGNNGQDLWEQVYLVRRGENYGWSVTEGNHPFQLERKPGPDPIVKPTLEHPHSEARSLTGGLVYYGDKLAELRGAYIYGDYSTGKIWAARHDGKQLLWHKEIADTTLLVAGFGLDTKGELLIVDHSGGGIYTLEPTPPAEPQDFPRKLSETGLFASVAEHRPEAALIPYSVNAPLWSDGASKERFIALPGTSQIDFTNSRGWNCPEGTVLVKTFSLDRETGNPASSERIETRLLTRQQGEWVGYSYIWNEAQSDATLVEAAGRDQPIEIRDPAAEGGMRQQLWHFPSRAECMVCHTRAANYVLGLTTLQMNKLHQYPGGTDNQLRALEHAGVLRSTRLEHLQVAKEHWQRARRALDLFSNVLTAQKGLPLISTLVRETPFDFGLPWQDDLRLAKFGWSKGLAWIESQLGQEAYRHTSLLPRLPEEYGHLGDPYDPKEPIDLRARSYLHSNCAICHVGAGGGNSLMELEVGTEPLKTLIFDVRPQHDKLGIADAKIVASGEPRRSVLLERMARRGRGQMPPLSTNVVDRDAVQLMHDWIKGLKPGASPPAPVK